MTPGQTQQVFPAHTIASLLQNPLGWCQRRFNGGKLSETKGLYYKNTGLVDSQVVENRPMETPDTCYS